jgi:hypothetical protein
MNRARFQDLLDSRGSDITGWPESERLAAESLLARDEQTAETLAQARYLDRLIELGLGAGTVQEGADEAASRIVAKLSGPLPQQERSAAIKPATSPAARRRLAVFWPQVAALSFATALGIAIGIFGAEKQAMMDEQRLNVAMDEPETGLNALLFDTDSLTGAPR